MAEKKKQKIIIPKTGIAGGTNQPRAIYSPETSAIIGKLGSTETMRASHVEPGSGLSQDALRVMAGNLSQVEFIIPRESLEGQIKIEPKFASHWFADMTPTGHDVVLGPFDPDKRNDALAREVEWLNEMNIPTCASCTEKQETEADSDVAETSKID